MDNSMADSDAEKTVLELLPKLLKEKPSFRYQVEDILSDRLVVKDEIKDLIKENAKEHQALLEKIDHGFEEMHRDIGGMGGTLGAMHEGIYVPKVIEAFEKQHGLPATTRRNVVVGEKGSTEEVDALVHNGTVWVLEVSATVRNSDVDRAEEKARKVRALPEFQGKKVVPVVAGTRIPESVRARAQEAGVEVFKE
jgi:hypothetical protein